MKNLEFLFKSLHIEGDIYYDKIRTYMHSTDGSIFRVEPTAIIYPKNEVDVEKVVAFASKNNIPIHSRGAGSGLAGAALGSGIILDFSKYMNKLLAFEKESSEVAYFTCEPGYRYGELEAYLKGSSFWFPAAPSSGEYASFGGMYGTNAGGGYSVKYGNVADYIEDATFILPNGSKHTLKEVADTPFENLPQYFKDIYSMIEDNKAIIETNYPNIPCNVCGYDLKDALKNNYLLLHHILGGSEGTLAIVTKLTFRVIRKLPFNSLVIAYFSSKTNSSLAANIGLKHDPAGIEIMDKSLLKLAATHEPNLKDKLPLDKDNVLMFEFEGETLESVEVQAKKTIEEIKKAGLSDDLFIAISAEEMAEFWAVRKAAVPILYLLKGRKKILALVEDAAVPTDKLVEYFDCLYQIFDKHKVEFVSYGHIAKGLLHNRPLLDLKDRKDIALLRTLADEVFELVHRLGGTISGEHGDGRLRSKYIKLQYGEDLNNLFINLKNIFDPNKILNPDIITYSSDNQMAENLRYGADYKANDNNEDEMQYIWNDISFIDEAEKCHGCSKCTTVTSATRMCPVYKALRDEAAAPKAKANILRGLLSGALDSKAMYEEAFQYVIDHCIACGSCSKECPSHVNIPKLALEARARYAKRFGVPFKKKLATKLELMGSFRKFSPLISALMKPKAMRAITEPFTGLASARSFIKIASSSLYDKVEKGRLPVNSKEGTKGAKRLLYFAGCYATYLAPNVGEATIEVLNRAGFEVIFPKEHCCGIPHISKGLAEEGKKQIKANLEEWGKLVDSVDYIVFSCSSCLYNLSKEWLFCIDNELTRKVASKSIYVLDILKNRLNEITEANDEKYAYHLPCHKRLINSSPVNSSVDILKSIECDVVDMKSLCCGMAGSWGMSNKNYELSMKIATNLNSKIEANDGRSFITECPTCAMQLEHLSGNRALHPVEVVKKCLRK